MHFSEYSYTRPDIDSLRGRFLELVKTFETAENAEAQMDIMDKINLLRSEFDTSYQLCSIRHSIDTRDEFYNKEQDFFDENLPQFEEVTSIYYKALINSKFRSELEEKFGKQLFRIADMQLRVFKPEIINDLITENKLSTEYQELIASALIHFDGADRTIAEMVPYLRSTDRNVRQEASTARWNFFVENENAFDRIFDELVKTRHQIALELGFKNFIEVGYLARFHRCVFKSNLIIF